MQDDLKPEAIIQGAVKNPDLPKVYCNGFVSGHSTADMMLLLLQNGAPCSLINMSFTVAKSLHQDLGRLISQFEATTNHTVMTIQDIDNVMRDKGNQPANLL